MLKIIYKWFGKIVKDYMLKTIPLAIEENERKIEGYKTDIGLLIEHNEELKFKLKRFKEVSNE